MLKAKPCSAVKRKHVDRETEAEESSDINYVKIFVLLSFACIDSYIDQWPFEPNTVLITFRVPQAPHSNKRPSFNIRPYRSFAELKTIILLSVCKESPHPESEASSISALPRVPKLACKQALFAPWRELARIPGSHGRESLWYG